MGNVQPSAPTIRSSGVTSSSEQNIVVSEGKFKRRAQSTPYSLQRQSSFSENVETGRKIFSNFHTIQEETAKKWMDSKESSSGGAAELLKAESPRLGLKYRVVAPIACGMSAVVCKGEDRITGKPVAIKFLKLNANSHSKYQEDLRRRACVVEAEIQLQCSHENIVCLYDFCLSSKYAIYVMEYVPNTLLGRIVERNEEHKYSERETAGYIRDVAKALKHIHAQGIVHLDVKLDNILCTAEGTVKVCDFGVAARVNKRNGGVRISQAAPMFSPPEVLREGFATTQGDMWALGVVLYMLLCGYPCFSEKDLNKRILAARYTFPYTHWANVSVLARDLVSRLLILDVSKRYTAKQVLQHPWIQALDDYPLHYQPDSRDPHAFYGIYAHSNQEILKVMQMPKKATQFLRDLHLSRQMEKRGVGSGVSKMVEVWGRDILNAVDKSIDSLSENLSSIDSESFLAKKLSAYGQQFIITKAARTSFDVPSNVNKPLDTNSSQDRPKAMLKSQRSFIAVAKAPAVWISDEEASTCRICDRPFTVLYRRHHCRNCGQVVCEHCSNHRCVIESMSDSKRRRVCDLCFVQEYNR